MSADDVPEHERIPAVENMAAAAAMSDTGRESTFVGGRSGRIGVAIPIPSPLDSLLVERRASTGDPLAWSIPPHVTLVPPQEIADHVLPEVSDHLAAVAQRTEPFTIRLHGTDTFRPVSPVVFVALADGAEQVAALEQVVRAGVLGSDRAFPFHPHVTLGHGVGDAEMDRVADEMAGFDVSFEVAALRVYRYGADGRWHPLADHCLGRH